MASSPPVSAPGADGQTQASSRSSVPDSGQTATHHDASDFETHLEKTDALLRRNEEYLIALDESQDRFAQSSLGRVLRFLSIWEPHYTGALARSRCREDQPCRHKTCRACRGEVPYSRVPTSHAGADTRQQSDEQGVTDEREQGLRARLMREDK
ncbi:unnamed protein product [Vitrella brassicaformis CCMP3155]|uniref:Uncharacterized protein n=1 Tax=Vitrella brassicaformis (strain CCMP3155) TaxID=1169540 RepID=A0A0G4EVP9_VITBC|nr:unnamed protein product [Vitrella brassicaformis CCMP3155]|eukprot:CEM02502.1 unnamed protein product [Vitrella brassicaformis CCMP3155]